MQIFAISLLFLTLAILSMNYKEKNSFRILIESFLIFLFGVFSLLYLISDYFTGEGINSVVISTLKLGVLDAGFQEYLLLILVGIFAFIFLFVFAFFYHKRLKNISISKPQRLKGFIHNGFFILALCGIPLVAPYNANSMDSIEKFYPKAICMGDILDKNGYTLNYMQGASIKFAAKDKLFFGHGFSDVQGRKELSKDLKDKSYLNGWGLYDDTLLDKVYEKFENLSKKGDKFALLSFLGFDIDLGLGRDLLTKESISLNFPSPLSPKELKKSDDTRKLGIGINSLHILKI